MDFITIHPRLKVYFQKIYIYTVILVNGITSFLRKLRLNNLINWLAISLVVGALSGSASAVFLMLLKWAAEVRTENIWIICFLPLSGVLVTWLYRVYGKQVERGNNQIIEEVQSPQKKIFWLMAPLVLFGTVVTHLFGGSAGREGTAIQMGGSIADQFTKFFDLDEMGRKCILICGISAGFASVFGTPFAGAVFALEIIFIGRIKLEYLIPSVLTAIIASFVCDLWPIEHTHYYITEVPVSNWSNILLIVLAGILFGVTSYIFSMGMHRLTALSKKYIKQSLYRPLIGGTIVVLGGYLLGYKFLGLGVPTIVESFTVQQGETVFFIKLLLTVITLSAGYKGGEVTPLFFVGATLGSALSIYFPLPVSLLAGVGFVAVFAGATNAPLACSIMGLELFGLEAGVFIFIGCYTAYVVSGNSGIYSSQIIGLPKNPFVVKNKNKRLKELM